jgi:hypothetical protein
MTTLKDIIKIHLETNGNGYEESSTSTNELEIRFGTMSNKITQIDFDNVIKKLKSQGFEPVDKMGSLSLKIQTQFIDAKSGLTKTSNMRTTIEGIHNIQTYCKENSLKNLHNNEYMIKMLAKTKKQERIFPINKPDYNMRISYQSENIYNDNAYMVKGMITDWDENKKTFRYLNRLTFKKPGYPFKIEMSIVKSSNHDGSKRLIPTYTVNESNVFDNNPEYEIEIELDLDSYNTTYTVDSIESMLKTGIKLVLSGLQETNYPVSYKEQNMIKTEYMKLLNKKDYKGYISNRDFIGPSSYTLQLENVRQTDEDIPNIRSNYTVTDKADGARKMLYVSNSNKIYLIDTNMNVQYTGCMSKDYAGTLLDGEHILHNKNKDFINYYAAFDIYFIKGRNVRQNAFYPDDATVDTKHFRLPLLTTTIKNLNTYGHGITIPLKIDSKKFYKDNDTSTIFTGCSTILQRAQDDLFEYETDGLIFTPTNLGVGTSIPGEISELRKTTWDYSFKWKPAEFNTIDFLFKTKKSASGEDEIGNQFQAGTDASSNSSGIIQYKTGELYVGFDVNKHGYLTPCSDVIHDKLPSVSDIDNRDSYKPMKFYPTNPYDNNAHLCKINLESDQSSGYVMKTLEGQTFEDNTIIEFSYDINEPDVLKRWKPLRVRYDKTAEYLAGMKNFGNAYHVANSNWQTIHNPITREMIKTGVGIPDSQGDDDVYYNKSSKATSTRSLRDFHNLVVKKLLITSVSARGDTLIDYAVGKGGDFTKWISANLSFVFGIDISNDNLENKLDGACARYLNYRKSHKVMPYALFVNGDSKLNIRDGTALFTDRGIMTTKAVFGDEQKNENRLGKGVYRQYGKGTNGFDISSCQFALHYFFENRQTCGGFLTNVSECTKVGGYFIGACYDGTTIFNDLKTVPVGESKTIYHKGTKIWEVTKRYTQDTFAPDTTSLGYSVDIYQESINKTFKEYLVNFDYLIVLMRQFGFEPLTPEEASGIGLPRGIGTFKDLFLKLEQDVKTSPYKRKDIGTALNMNEHEKTISFFNKYYVFKKVRMIDAQLIGKTLMDTTEKIIPKKRIIIKKTIKRKVKP